MKTAAIPLLVFVWLAIESCPFVMAQDSAQAAQNQSAPPPAEQSEPADSASDEAPYAKLSKEQLERLVAPIALYPDALVAQILAASTFPTQITDAETWLQTHPGLSSDDLGKQVDQQDLLRFARTEGYSTSAFTLGSQDNRKSATGVLAITK